MTNSQDAVMQLNRLLKQSYPKGQARRLESDELQNAVDAFNEFLLNDSAFKEISNALIGPNPQLIRHFLVQIGEPSIQVLAFATQSSDLQLRRKVYEIASDIGKPALDFLISAVNDKDFQVRQQVARSLGKFENDRVQDALKSLTKDEVDDVRLQAIVSLSSFEQPDCETLTNFANDENSNIRRQVILGLEKCDDISPKIIENALEDSNRMVRIQALRSLAEIGSPETIQSIEKKIYDGDHNTVKREAIHALAQIGKPALDVLTQLTNHSELSIKQEAIAALRLIGETAIPALNSALRDENVKMRVAAVNSLSYIGLPALNALIKALDDESRQVKAAIISGLSKIGLPAMEVLSSIVEEERDIEIRKQAVITLAGLGEQAISSLSKTLGNESSDIRNLAMNRLSEFGNASLPALPVALNSNHKELRKRALDILESIGLEAIVVLDNALDNQFEDVQAGAVEILAGIGDTTTINPLIHALKKDNPNVKINAIWGLCNSFGSQSLVHLLPIAEHEEHAVRINTLKAIFQIGINESIANQIANLLESKYGDVSSFVADNIAEATQDNAYLAMGDAVINELVIRSSNRSRELFNSEVTSNTLLKLISSSPSLRSLILERLTQLAFHNSGEVRERVILIARNIFPQEFAQLVRARDTENPDAAADIMHLFGGNEAAYYLSEQQSNKLEHFREPLLDLEEISRKQWQDLSRQTKLAFYLSMIMTGLLFIFGVGLIVMGAYLLFNAEDPALKVGGAITSGIVSLATLLSNRFWKDPVDHIRKYSAQQARLEAAFIGYMNRVSQIRFVFETEASNQVVALDSLEKYQNLFSEASAQASQELSAIEGGS